MDSIKKTFGNAPVFVLSYIICMVPTYFLPYVGSNSAVLHGIDAALGTKALNGVFWLHMGAMLVLCFLCLCRGAYTGRGWLVIFPILAIVFDFVPPLTAIPLVPTLLHFTAIVVGIVGARVARGTKKCPHCAEFIQHDANVCRYCTRPVEAIRDDGGAWKAGSASATVSTPSTPMSHPMPVREFNTESSPWNSSGRNWTGAIVVLVGVFVLMFFAVPAYQGYVLRAKIAASKLGDQATGVASPAAPQKSFDAAIPQPSKYAVTIRGKLPAVLGTHIESFLETEDGKSFMFVTNSDEGRLLYKKCTIFELSGDICEVEATVSKDASLGWVLNEVFSARSVKAASLITPVASLPPATEPAPTAPIAKHSEASLLTLAHPPSFDCAKASSSIETMICSDVLLASADVALAEAYSRLIVAHRRESDDPDIPRSAQLRWIKSRNECSDRQCVITKYQERMNVVTAEINKLMSPPPSMQAPLPSAPAAPPAPQLSVIVPLAEPSTPAPPAAHSAAVVCPNYREAIGSVAYPREAAADGIQGEVLAGFTLSATGQIRDIVIKSSTNRIFNKPAIQMIQTRLTCKGQGQDLTMTLPISFKLN